MVKYALSGFLALLILSGCYFLLTYKPNNVDLRMAENKNSTNSTKIYTNSHMGYSINIPQDWEIHSTYPFDKYDDGTNVDLNTEPYIYLRSKDNENQIELKKELMYENKSFSENVNEWRNYYLSSSAELGNAQTEILKEEKYKTNNKDTIKYTISYVFRDYDVNGTAIWEYIQLNEKHLLSIKYQSDTSKKSNIQLMNDIVNTLTIN